MATDPTPQEVLALPLEPDNDSGRTTVGDYLVTLLALLWEEGELFSSKRPFGNSNWEYDLYFPLVRNGLIGGVIDDGGFLEEVDEEAGNRLIASAIKSLGSKWWSPMITSMSPGPWIRATPTSACYQAKQKHG